MFKLLLLSVLLALLPLISSLPLSLSSKDSSSDYTSCTSTQVTVNLSDNGQNVLNYTFILSVSKYQLLLTDFKYQSVNKTIYRPSDSTNVQVSISGDKFTNCVGHCTYPIVNSTVMMNGVFLINDMKQYQLLLVNTLDQDFISDQSGSMFLKGQPTVVTSPPSALPGNMTATINQTCVKFVTVPAPVMTPTPMCLGFNSSVQFYRYGGQKFADISANITYTPSTGSFIVKSTDSPTSRFEYYSIAVNGVYDYMCGNSAPGTILTCQSSINSTLTSSKTLFEVTVHTDMNKYTTDMGRFMVRNNVPLKEEGIRFTPMRPCQYMFSVFGSGNNITVTSTSQFCCTSFAS